MVRPHLPERTPTSTYRRRQPVAFSQAHEHNIDLYYDEVEVRLGFGFDFKRRPVSPIMRQVVLPDGSTREHLSFETVPWPTLDEFIHEREIFETYREKAVGQLKTLDDWERWQNYKAGSAASRVGCAARGRESLIRLGGCSFAPPSDRHGASLS